MAIPVAGLARRAPGLAVGLSMLLSRHFPARGRDLHP
jgi:hypothetical protein